MRSSNMWSAAFFYFNLIAAVSGWPQRRGYPFYTSQDGDNSLKVVKKWIEMERLEVDLPKNGDLFEGDMVMSPLLRGAVLRDLSKRSALVDNDNKWRNGIIPYELHSSLTKKVLSSIKKAVKEFKKYTCIRFVRRKSQKDYILFKSEPHKCSSSVGKVGGRQNITLGPGCFQLGTVLHEMMHALGVVHEQSRPDRDKHINVLTENIEKKYMHNFRKYDFYDVTDLNVPYNFASIMHYRNTAFSKNGEPTLRSIRFPGLKFGQRKMFSAGDISQINKLYPCGSKHVEKTEKMQMQSAVKTDDDGDVIPNAFDKLEHGDMLESGYYKGKEEIFNF